MIEIIQTCDRCGTQRKLNVGYHGGRDTIKNAARVDGWVALREFNHICEKCLQVVLPA